ncbi:MAG: MFS transporter [Candidatus Neomarinimicrobiota bacterium]|jgi:MFS family permease
MTKFEKIIIGISGSSHSLVHALMLTFPSLIPIIQKEYNVGLDTLGFVVSISALLFGLGAIPAGWLDRYLGGKKLMIIYQLGSSLSALVVAFSPNFTIMVVGLSFIGLFCSIYHPTGLTLISQSINKVSKGMAVHGMFGSLGSAFGPLLAVSLAGLISWRASYFVLGILNAILALITFINIPNKTQIINNQPKKSNRKTNKTALIYYFITNSFLGMAYYGFTTFMPIHLSENTFNFLPEISHNMKAGLFPTIVFLAGMIGALLGGKIGDKFDKRISFMIIILLNIPVFFLVGITSNITLIICSIMLGIIYFSNQPIGNTLVSEFSDNQNRGFIYGLGFFISFGIGSFAAGLSGVIAVNYGVSIVFPVMGILLFPGLIFSYLMYRSSLQND